MVAVPAAITPAHVLQVLAAACSPNLPDPMPWPHLIQFGEGSDGTILPTGPTLSMQFEHGDDLAVRRWAELCGLHQPAFNDTATMRHYAAASPANWWDLGRAPGWAGCRKIDAYCVVDDGPLRVAAHVGRQSPPQIGGAS